MFGFLFIIFLLSGHRVVFGETTAERQALFAFFHTTNKIRPWKESCTDGWRTMSNTTPPATFCNSFGSSGSTFSGVYCLISQQKIVYLSLAGCGIQGTLPAAFSALRDLEVLYLFDNQLQGTLPPEWGALANLIELHMHNNQLTGSLPPEWSTLGNLEELGLSLNQLNGSLPASWSRLSQFLSLRAAKNTLQGPLPPQWASWTKFQLLVLDDNNITGVLPPEWGTMPSLQYVYLNRNQLQGTLPSAWGSMSRMEELGLSDNQLRGTLPSSWSGMTSIVELYLHVNRLVGELPATWPRKMSKLDSYQYCQVNCDGRIGEGGTCRGVEGSQGCLNLTLWYNCLSTEPSLLPSGSRENVWNWSSPNMYLGPQRDDCWTETLSARSGSWPSQSRSVTFSGSSEASVPSTLTWTATHSATVPDSASVSDSPLTPSGTVPLPFADVVRARPNLAMDSLSTASSLIASLVGGVGVSSNVQRASLQRALRNCRDAAQIEEQESPEEPLDIASSPLQFGVGEESGYYTRGCVVGNLVLVAGFAFLGALVVGWRHVICGSPFRQSLADCQLPGVLSIPAAFVLQPLISSSVWCVRRANSPTVEDVLIGLTGLVLSLLFAAWATWWCTYGKCAVYVKQRHPQGEENDVLHRWLAAVPKPVRRGLLGLQDTVGQWTNRQKNGDRNADGFVERYGTILCTYREGREWFVVMDLLLIVGCGIISGLASVEADGCNVKSTTAFLVCIVLGLLLAVVTQPYNEPLDHLLCLVSCSISIVWAILELSGKYDAADTVAEIQMWLGAVTLVVVVIAVATVGNWRAWVYARLVRHSPSEDHSTIRDALAALVDDVVADRDEEDKENNAPFFLDQMSSSRHSVQVQLEQLVFAACDEVHQRRLDQLVRMICRKRAGKAKAGAGRPGVRAVLNVT